jgi:hypothetical protein
MAEAEANIDFPEEDENIGPARGRERRNVNVSGRDSELRS